MPWTAGSWLNSGDLLDQARALKWSDGKMHQLAGDGSFLGSLQLHANICATVRPVADLDDLQAKA